MLLAFYFLFDQQPNWLTIMARKDVAQKSIILFIHSGLPWMRDSCTHTLSNLLIKLLPLCSFLPILLPRTLWGSVLFLFFHCSTPHDVPHLMFIHYDMIPPSIFQNPFLKHIPSPYLSFFGKYRHEEIICDTLKLGAPSVFFKNYLSSTSLAFIGTWGTYKGNTPISMRNCQNFLINLTRIAVSLRRTCTVVL